MTNIDEKIITILKELHEAHAISEKFNATEHLQGKITIPRDIYEMGLAYDTEEKIQLYLDLAYNEKYPGRYTDEQIKSIKEEIERLSFRIRAWKNRKFPCQFKDKV